jgi:murein DD-endopeptidase MepM/ murein hydrolase activator NlpD
MSRTVAAGKILMVVRRLPLAPLLAVAVATMSSTGHGTPAAPQPMVDLAMLPTRLMASLEREVVEPAASWRQGLRDTLDRVGGKLAGALDTMRGAAKLDTPDLTALKVEPVANATTSGFGWREDPINKRRKFHAGTDIRGKHGTPVSSAGDGLVVFAGYKGGYGNVIFIDHGKGIVTRYAHLKKIETKVDALVTAGQRIGQVGSTGRTTGPHLHFEVRIDGRPVDPTTALLVGQLERESPIVGRLAAQVLAPAHQSDKDSDVDPPKASKQAAPKKPRPVRVAKPLS